MLSTAEIKKVVEHSNYSFFMLVCIMCYAFFNIAFQHVGNFFLGLIIIGSLPIFVVHKKDMLKNPIVILFIFVLFSQVLSWINSTIYLPEVASTLPVLDRLGKLFVFFFIAYWLKGNVKYVALLWLFFIFGFLFACIVHADFQTVLEYITTGERVDFAIKNSQFDSMLAGTGLLMLLSLLYITGRYFSLPTKQVKFFSLFTISMLIVLFFYIVLITQSRQVWLGLTGAATMGVASYIFIYKVKSIKSMMLIFFTFLGLFFILSSSQIVQNRLLEEKQVVHTLIERDKPVVMTSIGIRVNSWLEASEWIQKHPIVGLDSGAIKEVIQQSERFNDTLKKKYGHLHNFFIETLVAYGIVGFLLIILLYYFVIRSISRTTMLESEKNYFLLLSICFISYWLIINNFESFNSRWLGVYTHNIILASFYTFYLAHSLHLNKEVAKV